MKCVPSFNQHAGRQRGQSLLTIIIAIVIIVALGVAAWLLIIRPHNQANDVSSTDHAAPTTATSEAPPPPNVAAMGTEQLLDEASKAMSERRYIAPKGNNAVEFYLEVLAKDPDNSTAQSALREIFPFAASAVEQEIDANRFDAAEREIGLLSQADPTSYTLTILRSKLDAQRKLAARAEEQRKLEEQAAQRLAAQQQQQQQQQESQPAEAETTSEPAPVESAPQVASQPSPSPQPTVEPTPTPTPEPEPAGPTRGAVLVHTVQAHYPPRAKARHLSGWVVVQFRVDTEGNVQNAHAVDSKRGRIFERAALQAIEQWKFKPALRNGKPVAMILTQRFDFQ